MNSNELLQLVKDVMVEVVAREMRPAPEELARLKEEIHQKLTPEAPIAELGWDSVRMTWLLVRLEERLDIDTSNLSLYELFTVGDMLKQIQARVDAKK